MDSDTVVVAPVSQIEPRIAALHGLQGEGRHGEALAGAEAMLGGLPENRDLLLIAASCLRHLGRIPEALGTLERLEGLQPRFSRLHQERGLCHVALKDAPRSIEALLRAVNLNPALPVSWRMLEGVYRLTGESDNTATAAHHVATLKNLPPDVVSATSLFFDGDLGPAEEMIRAFLLRQGNHPEAMRLLAKIGMARDVLDDAERLLEAVLVLVPNHRPARHEYAQTLVRRHKYARAREELGKLLALDPGHLEYQILAGEIAVGLGEQDSAIAIYEKLRADMPANHDLHLWLAHALKTVGRLPEAIDSYRAAAAARPDFGDAYWSLANLKTYRFSDDEIVRMRRQEALPTTGAEDRIHLCFALGKAFEDRGEMESSWDYYVRGNSLKRGDSRYRAEVLETNTAEQKRVCTQGFFGQRAGWGDARRDPIFILGLPRSGSTLLEQILASHSEVEGTQELSDIPRIVLEMQGRDPDLDHPRYPACLESLEAQDFAALGARYMEETRVYRGTRPFFIDKMPNNFRHVGLIHLMLPNARIIDARRDPVSCCFSNLKQLFANGQEFAYSIPDIARYYRTYLELMAHWEAVLPGRILRVQHEDVIDDLEGSVRRLLAYCDLPFEQSCVDFYQNRRSVRTPSSEQVRRPIFREGLEQWKAFEPWLGPLKDALGDAGVRYRD